MDYDAYKVHNPRQKTHKSMADCIYAKQKETCLSNIPILFQVDKIKITLETTKRNIASDQNADRIRGGTSFATDQQVGSGSFKELLTGKPNSPKICPT